MAAEGVATLQFDRSPDALARVPRHLAFEHEVLPLAIEREGLVETLVLGVSDPKACEHVHRDGAGRLIGLGRKSYVEDGPRQGQDGAREAKLAPVVCPDEAVHRMHVALRKASRSDRLRFERVAAHEIRRALQTWYRLPRVPDPSDVVESVFKMYEDAVLAHSSDIKLEPMNPRSRAPGRTRFLVLGRGRLYREIDSIEEYRQLVAVIKSNAIGMNHTKDRIRQDGRFEFQLPHRSVSMRISSIPTRRHDAETVTIRVLDLDMAVPTPLELGMPDYVEESFREAVYLAGIFLIVGAPGAGKSTSSEAAIALRNDLETVVFGVGDPIEIPQYGVMQVEVDEAQGLTPTEILRATTRHAPDFGNAGEGRDPEYTKLAFDLSGIRPVVLTVHADSALDGPYELINRLHIDPSMVEGRVHTVMAQHLVRQLCSECKEAAATPDVVRRLRLSAPLKVFAARKGGCDFCDNGYTRRIGVFEILPLSKTLRRALAERKSKIEIETIAAAEDFRPMFEHALDRLIAGETSFEEVEVVPGFKEQVRRVRTRHDVREAASA